MKNSLILHFLDEEIIESNRLILKYRKLYTKYIRKNCGLREKRIIVLKIIKDILDEYSYFNNNAIAFFTGSYARGILKESSDFDLNVIYLRGSGKRYKKYEELFYYIVCSVFNMKRKLVHPVLVTFNDGDNTNYVNKIMDQEDYKVTLLSSSFNVTYIVPGSSKKRMYLQYLNNKNYRIIFNKLEKSSLREWQFTFKFLNENKKVKNYYNSFKNNLVKQENLKEKSKELKSYIKKLINKKFNTSQDMINTKDIKQYYQQDALQLFYNYILYNKIVNKNPNIDLSDLNDQNIYEVSKIIEYMNNLELLKQAFQENKLEYSIHESMKINIGDKKELRKNIMMIDSCLSKIKRQILNDLKKNNF